MALRPEIFVSAVVPELNASRKAVKQALLDIGAQPVEQTDFSIEYGPLHGVLNQLLSRCDAVIHLAGEHYGLEPDERTLHAPRRSFAQYEVDVARLLGKPIYVFAPTEHCPVEAHAWEDEEKRLLQHQHRLALAHGDLYYAPYSSPEELGRLVRALRSKLVVRRSLARLPARPLGARFIGRQRLLHEVSEALAPGRLDVLHRMPGTTFSGGFGKTTVALELGWRLHDDHRFDYIFWVPAGPRADLEASLAALARTDALALLPDEIVSHRARLHAVFHWLEQEENAGRWLMVFDGVDDEIAWWSLRTLLPNLSRGAILLTGRLPAWPGVHEHVVAPFSAEQARDFGVSRLEGSIHTPQSERQAWDKLADALGRLPLALEIAAAHLRASRQGAREFLAVWGTSSNHAEAGVGPTVADMVERSVDALDPAARSLLRILCCLAAQPAAIPIALFEHRGDWPQTSASLEVLERRALVLHDEASQTIAVHRLVREIVRDRLTPDQFGIALAAARAEVDAVLQRAPTGARGWDAGIREMLIPHCRALMGQLNGHPQEVHASGVARALGDWLKSCGRVSEAETFYRRALAIEERRLGPSHHDLAPRIRDLAQLLRSCRRLEEAEQLYRRLVAMHESEAQPDLSALSGDLTQFASCLRAANRLQDAEALCRQALEISERAAGPNHPRVALALHHLAGVLEALHRYREAERLYRRALTLEEKSFGESHPRLASRLYHLGHVLAVTKRVGEAEMLFRRAIAIDEQNLGPEHPDLAPALEAFAVILEDAGERTEAEAVYRRAIALHEQSLGPEHPETAIALSNLAGVLEEQERLEGALELFERAAEILSRQSRRMRGPHPHLRSALENLGRAFRKRGMEEGEIEHRLSAYRTPMPKRERSNFAEE